MRRGEVKRRIDVGYGLAWLGFKFDVHARKRKRLELN